MRTLPYVKAWHDRYAAAGLRVVGVHCPGFEPSRDEQSVRRAVARLCISYPVLIDTEREPLDPLRPEDAPGARLAPQTPDRPGAYSGPYGAGGVWAVLDGSGAVRVN